MGQIYSSSIYQQSNFLLFKIYGGLAITALKLSVRVKICSPNHNQPPVGIKKKTSNFSLCCSCSFFRFCCWLAFLNSVIFRSLKIVKQVILHFSTAELETENQLMKGTRTQWQLPQYYNNNMNNINTGQFTALILKYGAITSCYEFTSDDVTLQY